jgi:hypothetical protein
MYSLEYVALIYIYYLTVRHFFCIYDQDYVHAMSQHITDSVLSTLSAPAGPSQLIIIGCGKPSRIVPYTSETEAAFPIYTDPSGKIYDKLQMKKTFACISRPPSYTQISFFRGLLKSLKQMGRSGIQAIKGGSWRQNGGEWIFRDGRCVYVHRMENVSDHLTAEQLLDLLRTDDKQAG